jgi:GAF domain-containing protein
MFGLRPGGVAVTCQDLSNELDRWPTFVPAAIAAGFQSVVAVPLRLRTQIIAGLNMFHSLPEPLTDDDQRLAQALADVATTGILQQRSTLRSSQLTAQLQVALNSRVVIEQAKGVLAERDNVDMDTAFAALRSHARINNLKLSNVATAIVRGELTLIIDSGTTAEIHSSFVTGVEIDLLPI